MITVHHLEDSRSQRILWLLEELGLDYGITRYERDPKTMLAPESLSEVHPLGKSPVITHDGHTIAETGAILEYLADLAAPTPWRPDPGTDALLDCRYWLHAAEGSLMPLLVFQLVMSRLRHPPVPWIARPVTGALGDSITQAYVTPRLGPILDLVESTLSERPWFAGDHPTLADVQMIFPLEALAAQEGGLDGRPATQAWVRKVQARPAYQEALRKGGPYSYGPRD